ncbi:hypothetical protein BC936DRAFT_147717 [Jimgerdemannia flammicorona]|uniref:Homeobox domain-containing protein n=1 Tax=Jimgerdemannia flammicorona TaxID=994334 RepID=A0A433D4Q6_9FUNG|nr:hypothetical protein BC936DRAFT_147717 [Jimgerdemannia flammicorona]
MATAFYPGEYLFDHQIFDDGFKGAYSSFLHEDMAAFNEVSHHESFADASIPERIEDPTHTSYCEQPDFNTSLLAFSATYGQSNLGYTPIAAHPYEHDYNSPYFYQTPRHVDMPNLKHYERRPLTIDTHDHSYLHADTCELVPPPVLSPTQLGYPESASDVDDTSSEGSSEPHEYYAPEVQDIPDAHPPMDLASPVGAPDQLSGSEYELFRRHPHFNLWTQLSSSYTASCSLSSDRRSPSLLTYIESLTQSAFHNLELDTSMHPYDSVIRTRIIGLLEVLIEMVDCGRDRMHSGEDDESADIVDLNIARSDFSNTASPTMTTITPDTLKAYSPIKEESDSDDADDDDECHSGDSDAACSPSPVMHSLKRVKRELPKDDDEDDEDDTEGSSCEHPSKKRKTRENYDRKTTKVLMDWFLLHDGVSPNQKAKDELSKATGKTPAQIATWYQNARRRYQQKLQRFRQLNSHHPSMVYDYESFDAYVKGKESEPCRKRNKGKPDSKNA